MSKRILITGATGNVGMETIRSLFRHPLQDHIIAGVRNIDKSKALFRDYPDLQFRYFDFDNIQSYGQAFDGIEILFLLRPPRIADAKLFGSLIDNAYGKGIRKIVFLSVQGAEKTSYIPHAKIEKIIMDKRLEYVFLRPSYFMHNLTTTLAADIKNRQIVLPAGKAVFNWIDVADIGEIAAEVLLNFDEYANQALEITGDENLSFAEAVSVINSAHNINLGYKSPNLIRFFRQKRRQGIPAGMIFVMIMLHYFPRFQKPPRISDTCKKVTGKDPARLSEYIARERDFFI